MKSFAMLGCAVFLAGCFGGDDIECDSSVTKNRIIRDFDAHLREALPDGAPQYISSIELTEVVTLAADKEAKTRSCEAKVIIHTSVSDATAYQSVKYANQSVSGGNETTRTMYEYIDTFQYIAQNVFDVIRQTHQSDIAKNAGFSSYGEYKEQEDAKARLINNRKDLDELSSLILQIDKEIKEIYPTVAPVEDAIRAGKSVMLSNNYLSMSPVLVKVGGGEVSGFGHNLVFLAELANTSSLTFDTVYLKADVYINGQNTPFQTKQFTTFDPDEGFKPGEVRKVKISVSGSTGIGQDFLSTTAWKEAKSVQILLSPSEYKDSTGREGQIGQYYDAFSFGNQNRGEPIVWSKYQQLSDELRRNTVRRDSLQDEISRDAALIEAKSARQ